LTENNKKGILNLAISYGGRQEIIWAVKNIFKKVKDEKEINEETISKNLWTEGLPDPDLIIRTGGETRLSNFLTWQSIYSELYFTNKYWPDFSEKDLEDAFKNYSSRERRFGK
jgi:undecaprenyl diphosphate synthase